VVGPAAQLIAAARRIVCVTALVLAGAAQADAADGTYRVTGSCREGQPQGGYMLRSGDGRLRVQGAFSHGQRVGSFIFWSGAGTRVAHLPFDADALSGTLSLWYPHRSSGEAPRKLQAGYRDGRRHGHARSWYPGGRLRAEFEYEDDALRSARAWTEAGRELREAEARALAEKDRAADDAYLDSLLATVRRHLPDCAPPPPAQRAGIRGRFAWSRHATG